MIADSDDATGHSPAWPPVLASSDKKYGTNHCGQDLTALEKNLKTMSNDPTARILQLLSLLQTYKFWPGAELADAWG